MAQEELIKLFDAQKVRVVWDDEKEKYFFSVTDVVAVLTDSADPKQYVKKMRSRDPELDSLWGTICTPHQFVSTDGRKHGTSCADVEGILRIIQSIPSKKAEPFKQWLAKVGAERIHQMEDPERSLQQMMADYRRLGYSEKWINQRIKSIEIRKGLTDEWQRSGVHKDEEFAMLTDMMSKVWSGMTTKEYKQHKGLTTQNLRDNMTNMELLLNALAEQTATDISKERDPRGLGQAAAVAKEGAEVAKSTRADIEKRLGHTVISSDKAIDYVQPVDELPLKKIAPTHAT